MEQRSEFDPSTAASDDNVPPLEVRLVNKSLLFLTLSTGSL